MKTKEAEGNGNQEKNHVVVTTACWWKRGRGIIVSCFYSPETAPSSESPQGKNFIRYIMYFVEI